MLNRILILSVTVGNGHMRAAEAIEKAAMRLYPQIDVSILDTFRYASPLLEKVAFGTYMEVLKMSPIIYGYIYRRAERGELLASRGKSEFNRILNFLVAPKLVRYIKEFQPEVIVCTHPFPVGIMSYLKQKNIFSGPVLAAITDFTIHSFWVFPEIDYYLLGAEQLRSECAAFGIAPENTCATGIPIDPAFATAYEKKALRKALALQPELPTILITGGGLGMGNLEMVTQNLAKSIPNCQLLVIAGTNTALQEKLLEQTSAQPRIKVYGFVNNMHEFMAAADLLIGKPGGLSCAEALAKGLPMLIIDPLPGQEERNTQFLTAAGAALKVSAPDLVEQVEACLTDSGRLTAMASAAAALGKPNAASEAVQLMDEAVAALAV